MVETLGVAIPVFQVIDAEFGVVGLAGIPMNCLRRGYHSMQLYDKDGTRHGSFAFDTLLESLQYH